MGITHHLLRFLLQEHAWRPIDGSFLCVGRQSIHMTPELAERVLRDADTALIEGTALEPDLATAQGRGARSISDTSLFRRFMRAQLHTLDVSAYEGADILHDLNEPIPTSLEERFDFILNGSCLDNIFDPVTALEGLSRMLRPGGRILHWESGSMHPFQPYLMFSVNWFHDFYTAAGFRDVRAYLIRCDDIHQGWDVYRWEPLDPDLRAKDVLRMTDASVDLRGTLLVVVIAERGHAPVPRVRPLQVIYRSGPGAEAFKLRLRGLDGERPWQQFPAPVPVSADALAAMRLRGFIPAGHIPAGGADIPADIDWIDAYLEAWLDWLTRQPGFPMAGGGRMAGLAATGALALELGAVSARLQDLSDCPSSDHHRRAGRIHLLLGEIEAADNCLEAAAQLEPDSGDVRLDRALCRYLAGEMEEALADLAIASRELPDRTLPLRLTGLIQYGQGRFAVAINTYQTALARQSDAETCRNLGRACLLQGDYAGSERAYRQALDLEPRSAEAARNLGNTLFIVGRATEAVDCYRHSAACDPSSHTPWLSLGNAYMRLGQWQDAVVAFQACADRGGGIWALIGLRKALGQVHDPADAQVTRRAAAIARNAYIGRCVRSGRAAAVDPDRVRYLTPLSTPVFFEGQGIPVARLAPAPQTRFMDDLIQIDPSAVPSVAADQRWARQGLMLAGPGEITVRYAPTWTNSAIVSPSHYLRDTYYNLPVSCDSSVAYHDSPYSRGVDDLYDWLIDFSPLPEVRVEEPCIYLGGSPNFGHFIANVVSRLITAEQFGLDPGLPLYLYPLRPGFRQILETLFPGRHLVDMSTLAAGKALFRFANAYVPAEPPLALTCPRVRQIVEERNLLDRSRSQGRAVFVTRRNEAPRHRIGNEAEVEEHLRKRGFATVLGASLGFKDILAIFGTADIVVSPQGAQSVNGLFCNGNAGFLEILPANQQYYSGAQGFASIFVYAARQYKALWGPVQSMNLETQDDAQPIFTPAALDEALDVLMAGAGS